VGKISVEISDEVEEAIRRYIAEHYWKNPYGRLSKIVEEALKQWLESRKGGKTNE
jgi:Arc/MetJ-type ribon-helix-helix transcriptional regulator